MTPPEVQNRTTPELSDVRSQLKRVLDSSTFRTSKKCSAFLRYVVEEGLAGRQDQLKERTLGVALFERQPDYDTNQDPIVRNTAVQVRKRLAQYYYDSKRENEIRIELPTGSYIPEIYLPARRSESSTHPEVTRSFPWRWLLAGITVVGLTGLVVFLVQESKKPQPSVLDQFWQPLVDSGRTVVLCVGQGHTYKLAEDWDQRYDESRVSSTDFIPAKDVIPSFDRYLGLSDVQAFTRFVRLFTQYGKDVELRGGRSTSLANLRGRPAVLIGGFNNSWTLSLTGEQRFYFESDLEKKLEFVRDRLHPENRAWEVRRDFSINQLQMDYAIVTRVFSPTLEQTIVVAAGIRGGGTAAAGEFLTNPEYLTSALKNAPPGWQKKNIQFVLSTRMFSGNPGPAQVVATHYW